ncbi:MAG: TIGR04255 family protein [Gammaproteobacteria bacterium]|nr:TIGR04255 family protein [Gammaproteobacteria bacterium]
MDSARLPKTLKRLPLVDVLFEMRFDDSAAFADVLPGILFCELDPKPEISRLPTAECPKPIRSQDPVLRYSSTQRLEWDKYIISVGDHNLAISCKLPYPGWSKFKKTILKVINVLKNSGIVGKVQRFSVKYVDIIQGETLADQLGKVDVRISVGPREVSDEHINMQIHHAEGNIVHIQSFITGATARRVDNEQIYGIVVDTDSICNFSPPPPLGFLKISRSSLGRILIYSSNQTRPGFSNV